MSISSSWVNKPFGCPLTGLSVLVWSASTFSSAFLSLSTGSTDTGTQLWLNDDAFRGLTVLEFVNSQPNETSFPLSLASKPGGCSQTSLTVLDNWILGFWLGLLGVFTSSSNFWTQFFPPLVFKRNLRRRSRWRKNFLVYDLSGFHHYDFRDTISWSVVKDDCVRSCLVELKSFLLSKFEIDPVHRVLMSSPLFLLVPCKKWCFQANVMRIFVFFVHKIHRRYENCLSIAQILSSQCQSWICDGV